MEQSRSPRSEREVLPHSGSRAQVTESKGWQEYSENDDNCLSFADHEFKELHMKTEQLRRNSFGKSGSPRSPGSCLHCPWLREAEVSRLEDSTQQDEGSIRQGCLLTDRYSCPSKLGLGVEAVHQRNCSFAFLMFLLNASFTRAMIITQRGNDSFV